MPKKTRARAKAEVRKLVERTDPTVLNELIAEETAAPIVTGERPRPGSTINGQKVQWTHADVVREFPVVDFQPEETIKVTYQGVPYQLISNVKCKVPSVVRDIYYQSRRERDQAPRDLQNSTGFLSTVSLGSGTDGLL